MTSVNSSLFLGYGLQGDVGLPGDPGQPMINGVVEFVGFPKGDKGMQVCWKKKLRLVSESTSLMSSRMTHALCQRCVQIEPCVTEPQTSSLRGGSRVENLPGSSCRTIYMENVLRICGYLLTYRHSMTFCFVTAVNSRVCSELSSLYFRTL